MLNLETAQSPHKLRRIAIEPVSRVEGHGKVTILLDEENRVHQVRLHIVEFRGFEVFIEGRPFWEVPVTVQRLCGICPVSHHIAAGKAMDIVAGYGPLTPTAEKLRRLLHYGQIVQSHALHFFHLASPDLLFDKPGRLAYANAGPGTNGSQFFITEVATPHLNGGYTIFGQCDDAAVELVKQIARMARDPSNNMPFRPVKIIHISIVRSTGTAAKPAAGTTTKKPAAVKPATPAAPTNPS